MVGLIYLFIQKNKLARGVILVSLISCAAGCLVTLPGTWRIAILLYPLMILTALGIKFIIDKIRFSEWAVLASYAMIFIMFVSVYFTTWATDMYRNFFGDFLPLLSMSRPLMLTSIILHQQPDCRILRRRARRILYFFP